MQLAHASAFVCVGVCTAHCILPGPMQLGASDGHLGPALAP